MSAKSALKAAIFIGSSTESQDIALAILENLQPFFDVNHWQQDIFDLSETTIDSLVAATGENDFAILVCAPDDKLTSRARRSYVPRDNIIFEAGLFIGALGRERVFLVKPKGVDIKMPSDVAGLIVGEYPADSKPEKIATLLRPLCRKIQSRIEKLGVKRGSRLESSFAAAICYRRREGTIEYLLIKTTRGRWIFPKGLVLPLESSAVAALRYAEDEGGVVGRIDIRERHELKYLKEERGAEQRIICHLININHQFDVGESFRMPTWNELNSAIAEVTHRRPAKYATELRNTLIWADKQIQNTNESSAIREAGALVYRKIADGELEFLLVTSKSRGNWLIPKGHIEPEETPPETAAREAKEEAGVEGNLKPTVVGSYSFRRASLEYIVDVYAMQATREDDAWDDMRERSRKWFPRAEAADIVNERELKSIIEQYSI